MKNYIVITPAYNEEEYIESTIKSVICQSVLPSEWVIVDDGSSDNTAEIVKSYTPKYPFIKLVQKQDFGKRDIGHAEGLVKANEAAAFNEGFRNIYGSDYEYIVKLDADLSFECDYFGELLNCFDRDSKLGIAGGYCYLLKKGKMLIEKVPSDHVRGATKIYRRACFEEIGGIQETLGWDTIDELKAQMFGWTTRSFADNKVIHLRATGSIDGIIKGKVRHGLTAYILGYHPIFMFGRAVYNIFEAPCVIGSIAMLYGFAAGLLRSESRIVDPQLAGFIRKKQIKRMFHPKTGLELSFMDSE